MCTLFYSLYHVPLDELCVQRLAQSSGAALDDDARGFQGFDLGLSPALAA